IVQLDGRVADARDAARVREAARVSHRRGERDRADRGRVRAGAPATRWVARGSAGERRGGERVRELPGRVHAEGTRVAVVQADGGKAWRETAGGCGCAHRVAESGGEGRRAVHRAAAAGGGGEVMVGLRG